MSNQPGRPVRITSLSFYDKSLAEIAHLVDDEGAKGVDLIALPETWNMQYKSMATPWNWNSGYPVNSGLYCAPNSQGRVPVN
jgi:hypothetical protein